MDSQSPQTELAASMDDPVERLLDVLYGDGQPLDEFSLSAALNKCGLVLVPLASVTEAPSSRPSPQTELAALREALEEAREAIASLPEDGLGMAQIAFGTTGVDVYPIRDELLAKIDAALSAPAHPSTPSSEER